MNSYRPNCDSDINIYNKIKNKIYVFAVFKECLSEDTVLLTKITPHMAIIKQFQEYCFYDHMDKRIFESCDASYLLDFQKLT